MFVNDLFKYTKYKEQNNGRFDVVGIVFSKLNI